MTRRKSAVMRKKLSWGKLVMTLVLGAFVLTMLFPLLWMISTSFKLEVDVFKFPIQWIPPTWNFENYKDVWFGGYHFPLYYLNTIKVTLLVVVIQMVICSMGAYAFAKLNFTGKNILFAAFLATMMIPDQVTIVPKFMMLKWLKLLDTHIGLVAILSFSVYGVFLLRQYMVSVPDSLVEAAKIDGAAHFTIFSRIMIPMCKPVLSTLLILRFVWTWNDYQNPLIFLNDKTLYTLQQGMSQFASESGTYYALMMAASVCAIMPLLIVFIIGQKSIIEGMTAGAVKG